MWLIGKEVLRLLRLFGSSTAYFHFNFGWFHQNQELQPREHKFLDSKEHYLCRFNRRCVGVGSDCLPDAGILLEESFRVHSTISARSPFCMYVPNCGNST